jgi:bifunctional enzyme CysN/CysC
MLDAGMILIVTAQALTQADLDLIGTTVDPQRIETVWIGDTGASDLACDLQVPAEAQDQAVDVIRTLLVDEGALFEPW